MSEQMHPPWRSLLARAAILAVLAAVTLRSAPGRPVHLDERYDGPQGLAAAALVATARNWAGYIAETQGVTSVSGTWSIPLLQASDDERSSSIWIGIGGAHSNDLIQVGTGQAANSNGAIYAVFYEILPNQPVIMQIRARPGDLISAAIRQMAPDLWLVQAADLTNGQSDARTIGYHSTLASADWIVEAPANPNGSMKRLANFGAVQFRSLSAVAGDQPIDLSGAIRVTMTDGTNDLVRVSPNASGGFDASYVAGPGS